MIGIARMCRPHDLSRGTWSRPSRLDLRAARFDGQAPLDAGLPHEQRSEPLLRFVGVVRGAAQFEIVDGRRPAIGKGQTVMVLEPGRLGAAALEPHEGASIPVASADRASHMRGDMT